MKIDATKTTYLINTTEDGYSNWLTVMKPDDSSGMIAIKFTSTFRNSQNPQEHQFKHMIMVTPKQLSTLGLFLETLG